MALALRQGDQIYTGVLYRRIPPKRDYITTETSGPRPSSHNFTPDTGEPYLSVEFQDDVDPEGHINRMLADPRALPGSGLFEIAVEEFCSRNLMVKYEPEEGARHFGVYGWDSMPPKQATRVRRQLAFKANIKRHPLVPE